MFTAPQAIFVASCLLTGVFGNAKEVMRKAQRHGEYVDYAGESHHMAFEDDNELQGVQAVVVDPSGATHLEAAPIEPVSVSLEDADTETDTEGEIADALRQARAELAAQIVEQNKEKDATDLALERAKEDKASHSGELEIAMKWLAYYQNKTEHLKKAVKGYSDKIDSLTTMSSKQQSEIDRLTKAHNAKHNAAQLADDLETTITNLNDQITNKTQFKKDTMEAQSAERKKSKAQCDNKITNLEGEIAKITLSIQEAQTELDLLNQVHTTASCAEKEAKNENICKRCTKGKPCGDTCVAANATCFHDHGCACKVEGTAKASSLLAQDETTDGHPLHKELNDAKAAIRKVIAQHKDTMDELKASLSTNEEKRETLLKEKRRALEDFEVTLKELAGQKTTLKSQLGAATTAKQNAQDKLSQTIADGKAGMKQLADQLRQQIKELEAERKSTESERASMITTCAEVSKALLDAHGNAISALDSELSQFAQMLKDAEGKLNVVKSENGLSR